MGEYKQDERSFYNETCLVTGHQSEEAPSDLLIIHNNALTYIIPWPGALVHGILQSHTHKKDINHEHISFSRVQNTRQLWTRLANTMQNRKGHRNTRLWTPDVFVPQI